jgi:predicted nucleotidyltransferase component of viral defense system
MRYTNSDAMRMALEQRLRNEAAATGVGLIRLRKRVAFERFLARLAATPTDWILKGAFALELRLGLQSRMTKDIDLSRDDDEASVTKDLAAAAAVDLDDFFSFRVRRTPALERVVDFRAVRYTVISELAGRRFEQFPLDVGLVDASALAPDIIEIEGALAFADIPLPPLAVIAIEQHIAEKLHAYTAAYGTDGRQSTRVKDLIDLVLIARRTSPHPNRLKEALKSTFERRGSQPLPAEMPAPPEAWATPYAQQAGEVGLPLELAAAHAEAAALLDPVLQKALRGSSARDGQD